LPESAVALVRRRFMTGARMDQPVFPSVDGGFGDRAHAFRRTAAAILDEAAALRGC
jgi:hypothetical protein